VTSTPDGKEFAAWFDRTNVGRDWRMHVAAMPLSRVYEVADEARRRGDAAPAALIHFTGQPEPSMTLRLSYLPGGINPAAAVDPQVVAMAEEGKTLPVGSEERDELYRELNDYLFENPIHAPLLQFSSVTVCRPEVVGCDNLFEIGRYEWRGIGVTE
jgi:hypothetical protein